MSVNARARFCNHNFRLYVQPAIQNNLTSFTNLINKLYFTFAHIFNFLRQSNEECSPFIFSVKIQFYTTNEKNLIQN